MKLNYSKKKNSVSINNKTFYCIPISCEACDDKIIGFHIDYKNNWIVMTKEIKFWGLSFLGAAWTEISYCKKCFKNLLQEGKKFYVGS